MDHYLPWVELNTSPVSKFMSETLTKAAIGRVCGRGSHTLCGFQSSTGRTPWLQQSWLVLTASPLHFLFPSEKNVLLALSSCTCPAWLHRPHYNPFFFPNKYFLMNTYSTFCFQSTQASSHLSQTTPGRWESKGSERVNDLTVRKHWNPELNASWYLSTGWERKQHVLGEWVGCSDWL